ncbi:TPA: sensor histidine kinase [Streptococcus suis]|uniref:Sensor histidine kinase n=2 Tax=Streptococcus suivaginalis TaxID=3028082 RepID=A0AA96ZZK3_9STRE|nr:sensor histidine kinase [Streptococcus sp. 29896]MCK4026826.1 sensor histidine kinase [Streptococcus suis]WNY47522.1 sensor histidine kinase [Streptococcus sp. 29896]HEL1587197.1 sensor histidine kinase [Streptococcus suis]
MMKAGRLLLYVWYAILLVLVVLAAIFPLLEHPLMDVTFWVETDQLVFTIVILIIVLSIFLWIFVQSSVLLATRSMRQKMKLILQNKPVFSQAEEEEELVALSKKVRMLTRQVQLVDNLDLVKREEIVEGERKRIARELHDTVSQELFASSMILSGIAGNLTSIDAATLQTQLLSVKEMLESAQKDLRILLLHLRPSELDGRNLVDGFELILREVEDKSSIQVHFQHQVDQLPKAIEDHLFRIAQEIISNALRHAKAQHLDVFLIQKEAELQLKITDDGIGMQVEQEEEVSYGLKNIQERVEDMAGTIKIRTAPQKGVSIDIRIPLLKGKEHEED